MLNHDFVTAGLTRQDAVAGGLNDQSGHVRVLDGRGVKGQRDRGRQFGGRALKAFICRAVMGNDTGDLLECGRQKTIRGNNGRPVPALLASISRKKAHRGGLCCGGRLNIGRDTYIRMI